MIVQTDYFFDFLAYYNKAKKLQEMNLSSPTGRDVNEYPGFSDPLMQYVTIYDCVERRHAGFSNALQQIWYGEEAPKKWQADSRFNGIHQALSAMDMMWLMLFHRLTGSGASFSHDHGFRNSRVGELALLGVDRTEMSLVAHRWMEEGRPIFTSIGNQIPPFPKPRHPHKKGSQLYLVEHSVQLVEEVYDHIRHSRKPLGITEVVKFIEHKHRSWGLKMFHFVLTAWAMDLAEYYPEWVDPTSHVNYGKNALESLDLMFDGFKKRHVNDYMECIMDATGNSEPMSLEDVLCDAVRYWECYVPKGYDHLAPWQGDNASYVLHLPKHPSYYQLQNKKAI